MKKKTSFLNKRMQDLTVLDGIKISGISMLLGLFPLGIIGLQEAIKERKAKKERQKAENKHLEAIINGREDSDTTW